MPKTPTRFDRLGFLAKPSGVPMSQTSDTEQTLRAWILSGFYGPTELREMLAEVLLPEDDEQALLTLLERELAAKDAAEADWPVEVVGDRLDLVEGRHHRASERRSQHERRSRRRGRSPRSARHR
jgi:hypothetical protein